jgi:hypothetical protein
LREDGDAEAFWQSVKTNLQAGRIRMLFVADRIPPELRRVVEFLNRQMDPAEVLALELRQFQGEGLKTIVPVVYGQTEEAQQKKVVGAAGVKGTIAALRAHRKRWEQKLSAALTEAEKEESKIKISEYDARIAELLGY